MLSWLKMRYYQRDTQMWLWCSRLYTSRVDLSVRRRSVSGFSDQTMKTKTPSQQISSITADDNHLKHCSEILQIWDWATCMTYYVLYIYIYICFTVHCQKSDIMLWIKQICGVLFKRKCCIFLPQNFTFNSIYCLQFYCKYLYKLFHFCHVSATEQKTYSICLFIYKKKPYICEGKWLFSYTCVPGAQKQS